MDIPGAGVQIPARDRRLRVGYVSADFKDHPVAKRMQDVYGLHRRDRVRARARAHTHTYLDTLPHGVARCWLRAIAAGLAFACLTRAGLGLRV